ncbi:MAG: Ig-like domain-containing protein [Solimonas sp.]
MKHGLSRRRVAPLLVCLMVLAACGGGHGDKDGDTSASAGAARIEIVQTGLLFTAAGQTRQLSARVLDESGAEIDVPVSWSSTDGDEVSVDADGLATAESAKGSSQIIASVDDVRSPPLLVVVASAAEGVTLVDDEQVVRGPVESDPDAEPDIGNTYTVVLSGITAPALDSLLVGIGSSAIAGRVVAVEAVSDGVLVTLRLVPMAELFPGIEIDQVLDLSDVPVQVAADVAEEFEVARDDGQLLLTARAAAKAASAEHSYRLPEFLKNCEVESAGFDADNPPIAFDTAPRFSVSFNPELEIYFSGEDSSAQRLLLRASPVIVAEFAPTITVAFEGTISCKAELFSTTIPIGGWLSFYVGGVIPFGVGVELDGKLTVAETRVGVKSQVANTLEIGLVCAAFDCEFRREVGEFTVTHEPVLDLPGLEDLRFEPALQVFAYAEAAVGNSDFESLRFSLLEARAGPELAASFAPVITQVLDYGYKSGYELTLAASARPGDDIADVLELLSLDSLAQSEAEIATDALASSPAGTVSATADRFEAGETVGFTVTLDEASTRFLGVYNVSEVLLVRKLSDTSTQLVARRAASAGDFVFDFSVAASAGGTADEFFAFVVTTLFPSDLFALEIAQAPGPGVPVDLTMQSVNSLSRAYCAYEQGECSAGGGGVSDAQDLYRYADDGFLPTLEAQTSATATGSAADLGRLTLDGVDGTLSRVSATCDSQSRRGANDGGAESSDTVRLDFRLGAQASYRVVRDQAELKASGAADDARSLASAGLYFTFADYAYEDRAYEDDDTGNKPEFPIESGQSSGVLAAGDHSVQLRCYGSVAEGYGIGSDGGFSASAQAGFTVILGAP